MLRSPSPGRRRRRPSPGSKARTFFPRIFADVEAARSSVHILMFGWREGEVGMRLAALLARKARGGRRGSGDRRRARLEALQARRERCSAGSPRRARRSSSTTCSRPLGSATSPTRSASTRASTSSARADHRKLYVIDGAVAWTGGAGIEDHFHDGRFHDVMVRVTGDVVRQAQAAFLTSFHGARRPAAGATCPRCFPEPVDPGIDPGRARAGRSRAASPRPPKRSASRSTARVSGST